MHLRYHTCGYPVCIRDEYRDWQSGPSFFDAAMAWNNGPLACCPHCGERLKTTALRENRNAPSISLRDWSQEWPTIRSQIETLLPRSRTCDPFPAQIFVRRKLEAFDAVLWEIKQLAAQLEEEASSVDNVTEDETALFPAMALGV